MQYIHWKYFMCFDQLIIEAVMSDMRTNQSSESNLLYESVDLVQ